MARPDLPEFYRRRGFSNRVSAAMFGVTVINFLLFTLTVGIETAIFTVLIRKALILDIEYPLSKKRGSINNALQDLKIVSFWTRGLPVSSNMLLGSVSLYVVRRSYSATSLSFGGVGPSSKTDSG